METCDEIVMNGQARLENGSTAAKFARSCARAQIREAVPQLVAQVWIVGILLQKLLAELESAVMCGSIGSPLPATMELPRARWLVASSRRSRAVAGNRLAILSRRAIAFSIAATRSSHRLGRWKTAS